VDTFLVGATVTAYAAERRLVAKENSNGFIPGEGAAAALVGPVRRHDEPQTLCLGLGFGVEPAPLGSGQPLRADGLVAAIRAALDDSRSSYGELDFRLTDNNGESYGFKDAALALNRTLREHKEAFDVWHPIDCIGEVGAAIVPVLLGVMRSAALKGYAPGAGALCHVSGEGESRAAMILQHRPRGRD
jgi:3-oxoacyl-[acyl-carrier-protein] synthase-1